MGATAWDSAAARRRRAGLAGLRARGLAQALPLVLALILAGVSAWPAPTAAQTEASEDAMAADSAVRLSGLPVPRFVSLGTGEANVRTGPGRRYPIDWVFLRRGMPLEVIAEFDTWRRIRDWEGAEGWVHQSLLSGRRTVIVVGTERVLRADPATDATPVARVQPGVVGPVLTCEDLWCEVEFDPYHGWLPRDALWGVYEDEAFD